MISKAYACPGGIDLFRYVVNEKKGYELFRNGLSGDSPKDLNSEMTIIQSQNLRCKNKAISIVLSPSIEDGRTMSDETLQNITKDFLKKMGFDPEKNQFIAFVHTEKQHKHVHIIQNRIRYDGTTHNDSFISKKAQKAAHEVALQYGLISAKTIQEDRELERNRLTKEVKQFIKKAHYFAIRKQPKNLALYQKEMEGFGIKVQPTINKQGRIQGFRFFHIGTKTDLKASEVDRDIKLQKLYTIDSQNKSESRDIDISDYKVNNDFLKSILSKMDLNYDENLNKKYNRKR